MTAKVLEGFGGKFAEQWVATLLTPAFVFWFGGFAAAIQHWGWQFFVTEFTRHPEPLQIGILVGFFCVIAASAFVVQRFDFVTLRFLEGYWPLWLCLVRQHRIEYYRRRRKVLDERSQALRATEYQLEERFQQLLKSKDSGSLTDAERSELKQLYEQRLKPIQQETLIRLRGELREMPEADIDFMPTRLGNLLRATERTPIRKYGLDPIVCWSRLWMLIPDAVKKDLQEARADLNTSARVWLWSLLFCLWSVLGVNFQSRSVNLWAMWPFLGIVSAWVAYQWAIDAAITYSELIQATFDLYRHLLYQSIRWHLPTEPEVEKQVGADLTRYLQR
jgi:hypothetical protein